MNNEMDSPISHYQDTGCEETATTLLKHYEPLVQMGAKKMSRNRPDLYEDLFQVGQMSLLNSLQKYDSTMANSFDAYAMKSLVGHMKNYLRDKSWYIQVPRRIKEKGSHIQKAIDELTIELKRSPAVKDIAQYMELSEEETIEILAGREFYQLASLDVPLSTDEGSAAVGDLVAAKSDQYQELEQQIDLKEAVKVLDENEKKIIHWIYNEGLSQRDTAQKLGISQMSVSRIQRRAIQKLKEDLNISSSD